jgi:radical SAM superfamily enzyme YgiQ (UPF0313 family)
MKVALDMDCGVDKGSRSYSHYLVQTLCPNVKGVTPEEADWIFATVSDMTVLSKLKKLRLKYPDKKIVMGGFFSYCGETALAYADMVNVGEGFEFFEALNPLLTSDKTPDEIFTIMESKPYVITKAKALKRETIKPSYRIDWDKCPVVQMSKKAYTYWRSAGCSNKCKFCYPSWAGPFQKNPETNLGRVLGYFSKHHQYALSLICNESEDFEKSGIRMVYKSAMVREYLKNPARFKKIHLMRFGIEGFSEHGRAVSGKPITNNQLAEVFYWTKTFNTEVELFFILGLPEDDRSELINIIPHDTSLKPRVVIQFHWIEYSPHTPYWRLPIPTDDLYFDYDRFFMDISALNRRMRCRGKKSRNTAIWRTMNTRIPFDKVDECWKLKDIPTAEELIEEYKRLGLEEYLWPKPETYLSNQCIKTIYDK